MIVALEACAIGQVKGVVTREAVPIGGVECFAKRIGCLARFVCREICSKGAGRANSAVPYLAVGIRDSGCGDYA